MVDLYPEDAANFIKGREDAKRAKLQYDLSMRAHKKYSDRMFGMYDHEPLLGTNSLNSLPSSAYNSPDKE